MRLRVLSVLGVGVLLGAFPTAVTSAAAAAGPSKVFVSSSGSCAGKAAYITISGGVAAAGPGGTVQVCPGACTEDVVLGFPVTLQGANAVVDPGDDMSSPLYNLIGSNAFTVLAPNVTIRGFTVEEASGDGIFLAGDHGLIQNVLAQNNGVNGINVDGSSYSTIRSNR